MCFPTFPDFGKFCDISDRHYAIRPGRFQSKYEPVKGLLFNTKFGRVVPNYDNYYSLISHFQAFEKYNKALKLEQIESYAD